MEDPSQNPYAAPANFDGAEEFGDQSDRRSKRSFRNALLRWSLVCIVSAAPSFFLGCLTVGEYYWIGVPAMLMGVAVYAFLYAALDIRPIWRQWMENKITRGCIIGAYSVRVVVSIFFPLGMANDMWAGMISINIVGVIFRGYSLNGSMSNPIQIFLTTIMQGVLLNCEIFLVVLLFLGCTRAFRFVTAGRSQ